MARRVRNSTKRPKKGPTQKRSRFKVELILEAAARILATHGHAGFNTNAIAALAGVSPGTLYQYFPNKGAVYEAVLHRDLEQVIERVSAEASSSEKPERINALIYTACGHYRENRALSVVLIREAPLMFTHVSSEPLVLKVHELVADALWRQGWIADASDLGAAAKVLAVIKGLLIADSFLEVSSPNLEKEIEHAVEGLLRSNELQ